MSLSGRAVMRKRRLEGRLRPANCSERTSRSCWRSSISPLSSKASTTTIKGPTESMYLLGPTISCSSCSEGDTDVRSARLSFTTLQSANLNCGSWLDRSRAIVLKKFCGLRLAVSLRRKQYDEPSLICPLYSLVIE